MVALNCATTSPDFSTRTGYGLIRSCSKHSFTPTLAPVESSNAFNENGSVGNFLLTSEKNALDFCILRLYV